MIIMAGESLITISGWILVFTVLFNLCRVTVWYLWREESMAFEPFAPGTVVMPYKYQIPILFHLVLILIIIDICRVYDAMYYSSIVVSAVLFYPYLRKPSPYVRFCHLGLCTRMKEDQLIYTSLVYLLGLFSNIYVGLYQLSFLCIMTCLGSILYHRHRESKFFNFDNIFATTHFIIFAFTMLHSWDESFIYFSIGAGMLPVAVFMLIYCGDPANIVKDSLDTNMEVVRYSRTRYDDWHTYWHIVSGFGPLFAGLYIRYSSCTGKDPSTDNSIFELKLMIGSLLLATIINVIANYLGLVPFN